MGKLPQRKKLRLKDYDYSQAVCYFITIYTNEYIQTNLFKWQEDKYYI